MSASATLNGALSIFLLATSVLISVYHVVSIKRNTGHLFERKLFRSDPSILLSYALVSVAVLSGVSLTMDSALTAELCPAAKFYGPSLYSLFKTIVYLILGVRIWISFKGSMYAYRTRRLLAWGALISVWTLSTVIVGNLTVTMRVDDAGTETKCIVNPSTAYIASQALLDLTAGVVNCVLFVSPICKLYKLSADAAGDDREASSEALKIKAVAYRQCFLSMMAILSSLISMAGIGALTDFVAAFVSFDMFVSTVSVILMYKWNAPITNKMLCCCLPKSPKQKPTKAESTGTGTGSTGTMPQPLDMKPVASASDFPPVPQRKRLASASDAHLPEDAGSSTARPSQTGSGRTEIESSVMTSIESTQTSAGAKSVTDFQE